MVSSCKKFYMSTRELSFKCMNIDLKYDLYNRFVVGKFCDFYNLDVNKGWHCFTNFKATNGEICNMVSVCS